MSVPRVAAAVFVKTPGYSPLKTRLAADLGQPAAEEFHRLATKCVAETLVQLSQQFESQGVLLAPCWAVAEEAALGHSLWSAFQTLSQGPGSLGERMHSVYSHLLESHDAVLLLGADSPQVTPRTISEAIASLDRQDFVLGPANDGGFYLLGGRKPIPLAVWKRVPYSVSETAQHMTEELTTLGGITHIEPLVDVDVFEDLRLLLPQLEEFSETTAQRQLAVWIEQTLNTEH